MICLNTSQTHKTIAAQIAVKIKLALFDINTSTWYGVSDKKGIISPPGDEFDIVLLSTVRSLSKGEYHKSVADKRWLGQNLGFITDPHRICVGLTRAKFGLVIFGE